MPRASPEPPTVSQRPVRKKGCALSGCSKPAPEALPEETTVSPAGSPVRVRRTGAKSAPRGATGEFGDGYHCESGRNCKPSGVTAASPVFSATGRR